MDVNITIKVDDSDIDYIMYMALNGGIDYWCDKATANGEFLGEYLSEQISLGGSITLHDSYSDRDFQLNEETFSHGMKAVLESFGGYLIIECGLDTYSIDEVTADMIIQCSIFGEVLYTNE